MIDWVKCPVCGEPDMRRETDAEGCAIIECTNHACGSNGGDNWSATNILTQYLAARAECARLKHQIEADYWPLA